MKNKFKMGDQVCFINPDTIFKTRCLLVIKINYIEATDSFIYTLYSSVPIIGNYQWEANEEEIQYWDLLFKISNLNNTEAN